MGLYDAGVLYVDLQFASLLPVLTAKENLLLPTIFKNGRAAGQEKRALEHLEMVGLADKANAYPGQLSGGQQRRIAIARSLMNEPEAILVTHSSELARDADRMIRMTHGHVQELE